MDGMSRAAGSPTTIKFQGREYLLRGLSAEDWGTIESYMLSLRPNPLAIAQDAAITTSIRVEDEAAKFTDPRARERFLAQAQRIIEKSMELALAEARAKNTVSGEEVFEFLQSPRGVAYAFWVCFEKQYPKEFKLEQMFELFEEMGDEERSRLADQLGEASGVGSLGN